MCHGDVEESLWGSQHREREQSARLARSAMLTPVAPESLPPFLKAWLFIIFQVFVLFLPSFCQVQMKFFEPLLLQACG